MKSKNMILCAFVIAILSVTSHAKRETLTFPVDTRKYILQGRFIVVNVPTSATDAGVKGQMAFDDDYFYRCIDEDTWVKTLLTTWTGNHDFMTVAGGHFKTVAGGHLRTVEDN